MKTWCETLLLEGDIVCLHSGFGQMVMDAKGDPDIDKLQNGFPVLNGRDTKLHDWIRDSGLAVLVAAVLRTARRKKPSE